MPRISYQAIGTSWSVDIDEALSPRQAGSLRQLILERTERFDQAYSRFRPDSLVTAMSTRTGIYTLPGDAAPLLDLYQRLYQLTHGRLTPLIGEALAAAGYDADYSLNPGDIPPVPAWEDTFSYDPPKLHLRRPALLDFGAAGKGYLADLIGGLLVQQGFSSYTIDASGDILHCSQQGRPLRVGLEDPARPGFALGVVQLGNQSICGSATNRRAWAGLHHIFDAGTVSPVTGISATWVVAKTALLADGLATALFLADPAELQAAFEFEYFLLRADGAYHHSPGFPAEIFSS